MDHPVDSDTEVADSAPGQETGEGELLSGIRGYVVGLVVAALLTGASFYVAGSGLIYGPGIPVALMALAVGQMGVHLVFFLHITTGSDNTNNVLALAFGVLIVALVMIGSLWIMAHLNHDPMSPGMMQRMQH
ncbi:cytochrome o ubiquinol oxidase subunit IV [uncultured Sphingomonas sp.]|uniref:cytochrome o ubiquinol oxidase subunit IV n=1 Tax=uncultured Sphingomonas sp. TaxID=158754 RepID=UPI0035C9554D